MSYERDPVIRMQSILERHGKQMVLDELNALVGRASDQYLAFRAGELAQDIADLDQRVEKVRVCEWR